MVGHQLAYSRSILARAGKLQVCCCQGWSVVFVSSSACMVGALQRSRSHMSALRVVARVSDLVLIARNA
eukprot:5593712-Pyramimonas_sp.AAC.2